MIKKLNLKQFIKYVTLSILGSLGVSCYILADTFFISKGLGTNGLAALNIAIPVYNFIYGIGLMLGTGGSTWFSICKNNKKTNKINSIYTNTIYFAVLFSVFFFITGLFFPQSLAKILGADSSIIKITTIYLRWLLLFAPAFIFNNIFLCFVRNDNSPHLPTISMIVGSFSNILLDYIFIFPMQMGIFGAILATGLSPLISILFMLPHWIKNKNTFRFVKTKLNLKKIRKVFSLGFPSLITQFSSGIVMIIYNLIILKLSGNAGVSAYGIIANTTLVTISVYTGISQGVQPLISNLYGKGNRKHAKEILKYAFITTVFISLLIYATVFILANPITSVFNSENNILMQSISVEGLRLYFISSPFTGLNIIFSTYFTSIEKPIPSHILTLLRGFILIIPIVYIFSFIWGMTGIWLACPIAEITVAAAGYFIYRKICK